MKVSAIRRTEWQGGEYLLYGRKVNVEMSLAGVQRLCFERRLSMAGRSLERRMSMVNRTTLKGRISITRKLEWKKECPWVEGQCGQEGVYSKA